MKKPRKAEARYINKAGYVVIVCPGDPNCFDKKRGNALEHRIVMARHLGRVLYENETVHHKNGNRQDNRIENLELWSTRNPKGQRIEDKVKYALEILKLYAPERLANGTTPGGDSPDQV